MSVYSEEIIPIPVGLGVDLHSHPANVRDGFCTEAVNLIADGEYLYSRKGFQRVTEIDTRESYVTIGLDNAYIRLPYSSNENWPVGIYACDGTAYFIRQFDRDDPSGTDTENNIIEIPALSNISGAVTYLSKLYVNRSGTIYSITNIDWTAGTVTQTSVGGPGVGSTRGLLVFKDRLWTWTDSIIYYSDAPASAGGYPETWSTSTSFLKITSEKGQAKIFSIVPSGNLLYVFTNSGLFTINVSGAPLNWYPRLIDSTITVNHHACALEHKGLIYFIDPSGVYVTNGSEVHSISEAIDPIFEVRTPGYFYLHKLVPFEDGILICRSKHFVEGNFPTAANRFLSDAQVYYTRLDNIAWTQFSLSTTSQFMDIIGGWDRIETKDDWQGISYLLAAFGQSNVAIPNNGTIELLKYQGYQDIIRREGEAQETAAVVGGFKTKVVRGEMFKLKRAKYAYINLSADTSLPSSWDVTYNWSTEAQNSIESGTVISAISALPESLVKIIADFYFRHVQASVGFTLNSSISEYSFLGLGIVLHTDRNEPRRDS